MLKNVISVIDGEAGSCGKAKVIGEIATDPNINLGAAVTNCMPNAGHTFVDELGNKTVFRNIPVSSVNPNTELFIGPGSAIDMEVFRDEYSRVEKYLKDRKIYVHEMVPLIESRHKERERREIKSGSTFKGCGAVTQDKVIRDKKLQFFKTFKNAIVCSNREWLERLYRHLDDPFEYVLLEGAQGCDLDLNHSNNYPFTTSRNVSTAQLLADTGISPERLLETIMVIRPFPIRISNVTKDKEYIYTGNIGSKELKWSQVNLASELGGYPFDGDIGGLYQYIGNPKLLKHLLSHCPEIYLMQLFGPKYRSKKIEDITPLEAMELERLMYKSRGINPYNTRVIDISMHRVDNRITDQSEQTSVTQMERRIADIDIDQLQNNIKINMPYAIYLNFFQHVDFDSRGSKQAYEDCYFNKYVRTYLEWLNSEMRESVKDEDLKPNLSALGTGPRNGERILRMEMVKPIQRK